jgi:exodeoxyribonuclease VII small subunit
MATCSPAVARETKRISLACGQPRPDVGDVLLTVPVNTDGKNTDAPDVAGLSYEQARDELVRVVQRLEAGGEPLEDSLALWERGEALATRCQEWLDGARERLAAAQAASGGTGTSTTSPNDSEVTA